MTLARWPDEGFARVGDVLETDTKIFRRFLVNADGKFKYAGEQPARWTAEPEIWVNGYWSTPYAAQHRKVVSLDTETKVFTLDAPVTYGIGKEEQLYVGTSTAALGLAFDW